MALDFIKYNKIAENGRELIRGDLWEWEFLPNRKPVGIYLPPDEILKIRCTQVTTGIPTSIEKIDANIRGHQIYQATTQSTFGELSFTLIDREDMSISEMMRSWADAICHPDTKKTGRKLDLTADILLIQYNTYRVPIQKFRFYNFQPNSYDQNNGTYSNDQSNISELTWGGPYEHYERERLSAPIQP